MLVGAHVRGHGLLKTRRDAGGDARRVGEEAPGLIDVVHADALKTGENSTRSCLALVRASSGDASS